MDKIDTGSLNRKPELFKSYFKNVGDAVIVTENVKVMFPERYVNLGLAFIGNSINVVGIYALLDSKGNYSVVMSPIFQDLSPYNVSEVVIDDRIYKVLYFNAGDVFMETRTLVKNDDFMYDIFSEFFIKGNIPWYLDYEDISDIFKESKKYAGSNIGDNPLTMEIISSVIARFKDDKNIRIRNTIENNVDKNKANPAYIGLNDIYYAFDNTGARLVGGYYGAGVTTAIMDPETKPTTISDLLRA